MAESFQPHVSMAAESSVQPGDPRDRPKLDAGTKMDLPLSGACRTVPGVFQQNLFEVR